MRTSALCWLKQRLKSTQQGASGEKKKKKKQVTRCRDRATAPRQKPGGRDLTGQR